MRRSNTGPPRTPRAVASNRSRVKLRAWKAERRRMVSRCERKSSSQRKSSHPTCALGFTFCRPISALALRRETIKSWINSNCFSEIGSAARSLTRLKAVKDIEFPPPPLNPLLAEEGTRGGADPACGSRCQSSSVMNGMKGWSRWSADSNTRARLIQAGGTFAPSEVRVISGLTHSRYQSQISCQKK